MENETVMEDSPIGESQANGLAQEVKGGVFRFLGRIVEQLHGLALHSASLVVPCLAAPCSFDDSEESSRRGRPEVGSLRVQDSSDQTLRSEHARLSSNPEG